jgi:hypothetical protein
MKPTIRLAFCFMLLAGAAITSCTKDSDPTPEELNRSSLTGTWMVSETSRKITYEVTISIDTASSNGLLIRNFAGAGQDVQARAFLSGTTLSLPTNELLSNGWVVNGSGTVTGTTRINWPYTLHDGANLYTLEATFTKK